MADLPALLLASLDPQTRRNAEQNLKALSTQPSFLPHLLNLVVTKALNRPVRLAGSVYLKNVAKLRWEEDVADQDKAALRANLVPAMLALSLPEDKPIRAQIAESVSLVAELDFPEKWPDLIDQLVASLSPTDYNANIGVLQTAHSIYAPWRAHVRSDELFSVINLVLSKFMTPFLQLFRQTAQLLLTSSSQSSALTTPVENLRLVAQAMVLQLSIFYDLTCQDLPPAIEDTHEEFFGPDNGWFQALLSWDPPELKGDADDTNASPASQIKTGILEIAELFIKLYPEQLQKSTAVQALVTRVWTLVGSNALPSVSDDALVSQSLRFISTAVRSGHYKELFSTPSTITSLIHGVVVPNIALREHDVEQFEDDPLEFVRLDLAIGAGAGGDVATRRQAAADVLRALVGSGYEVEATQIVGEWIATGLAQYAADKEGCWKAKDCAVFLLTALATRGSTVQHGVTSVNSLVDVVKFLSDHIFQDLEASEGGVHPILQVDAIRFLYTFRNQLTKPQLLSVFPLLMRHLESSNYVIYTYAAITIERVLAIRIDGKMLFAQADIHDVSQGLVNALLTKIESAGSAEKMAENDHLMKCIMRIIVTARQSLIPGYERTLGRLIAILGVISKNPSNPLFDQYLFESVAGLMRYVVAGSPTTLQTFENALFGPFTVIIQQDVDQYIPYTFQILAQMLSLHDAKSGVPPAFRSLLPFLLTPAIWQQKGSIPGLVRLIKSFLERMGAEGSASKDVASVLAVVQQRLVPSKVNDAWGFEILHAVVQFVRPAELRQYMKPVMIMLLTRMHANKTDQFVYLFTRFVLFTMALDVEGLSPDYLIEVIEEIQAGLWLQLLNNFIITQPHQFPPRERKLAAVGLTRLLCRSEIMLREPFVREWPSVYTALGKLFLEPQYLDLGKDNTETDGAVTAIDFEEQTAGYQAAYSRLAASETVEADPVAYVQDPRRYLQQGLDALSKKLGQQLQMMIGAAKGGRFTT